MDVLKAAMALIERRNVALDELEKFHETVESAGDDDLRVLWDVRLVRGKNEPLHRVQGSSSMPGLLGPKMIAGAIQAIQGEVAEKIAIPLTALFMVRGDEVTLQTRTSAGALPPPEEDDYHELASGSKGDMVARMAALKRTAATQGAIDVEASERREGNE